MDNSAIITLNKGTLKYRYFIMAPIYAVLLGMLVTGIVFAHVVNGFEIPLTIALVIIILVCTYFFLVVPLLNHLNFKFEIDGQGVSVIKGALRKRKYTLSSSYIIAVEVKRGKKLNKVKLVAEGVLIKMSYLTEEETEKIIKSVEGYAKF